MSPRRLNYLFINIFQRKKTKVKKINHTLLQFQISATASCCRTQQIFEGMGGIPIITLPKVFEGEHRISGRSFFATCPKNLQQTDRVFQRRGNIISTTQDYRALCHSRFFFLPPTQFHQTLGEILLANTDLTYAAIGWVIVHLAQHKDVQNQVKAELDEKFATKIPVNF